MQRLINKIMPFLLVGVAILAFTLGIMLLVYLFFFGAIIGLGLFILTWVRRKFFTPKPSIRTQNKMNKPGRTIDSDDWKEL